MNELVPPVTEVRVSPFSTVIVATERAAAVATTFAPAFTLMV